MATACITKIMLFRSVPGYLRRSLPAVWLLVLSFIFFPSGPASASTSLMLIGDEDGGRSYYHSPSDGSFSAKRNFDNGVSLDFHTTDYSETWHLDFAAPNDAPLTVGKYRGATRFPFQKADHPGFDVYGDYLCDRFVADFEVKEISYGDGNVILSFWATFEQRCDGHPADRGEIRFKADTPNSVTGIKTSSTPTYAGQAVVLTAMVCGNGGAPTGKVIFKEGTTVLGSVALSGDPATASFSISSLSEGRHFIRAFYVGDAAFEPSNSTVVSQVVEKKGATILSMDSEQGDYIGGPYRYYNYSLEDGVFKAVFDKSKKVIVSFHTPYYINSSEDHSWTLEFAAPNSGPLEVGKYMVAENYPFRDRTVAGMNVHGDGRGCNTVHGSFDVKEISYGTNHAVNSFWATFEQHCDTQIPELRGEIRFKADAPSSTTDISATLRRSASGQTVTFSATVEGAGGVPTGKVTFKDGAKTLGTVALAGQPASAALTTPALLVGKHLIRAVYGGSPDFEPSASVNLVHVVEEKGATLLKMESDPGDWVGNGLSYKYSLTDGSFGGWHNFGNIVYISFYSPGYSHWWDLLFEAPYGAPLTVGTYSGAVNIGNYGAEPGLDVSGDERGCSSHTGSFEVKEVTYGPHEEMQSFWATFEQQCERYSGSLRGEVRFRAHFPTTTRLSSSLNPSALGQSVIFTATVSSPHLSVPVGKVTFMDGATVLGKATLSGSLATANFATAALSPKSHYIGAVYSGDANYASSSSPVLVQKVNTEASATSH